MQARNRGPGMRAALLAGLCVGAMGAQAQVAGDLDQIDHNVHFQSIFPGVVVDPSPVVGTASRQEQTLQYNTMSVPEAPFNVSDLSGSILAAILQEAGIDVPEDILNVVNGVGDLAFVSIDPGFAFGAQVDYGGYVEVNSFGDADIDVDYPVLVNITYPAPNTIGCGHPFTINTTCVVQEQPNMLKVTPPFCNLEVGPVLGNLNFVAQVGLEVSACIGFPDLLDVCDGPCCGYDVSFGDAGPWNIFPPIPIATPPLPPLLNFCEAAFEPGANMADLLGCTAPGWSTPLLEGAQFVLDAYNTSNNPQTSYGFASFAPNYVEIEEPDLPTGAPTLPEIHGEFRKLPNSAMVNGSEEEGRLLKSNGSISDITKMEFDLIALMAYAGIETELSLGGGVGSVDLGDLSPTFQIDQNVDFEFRPKVHLTLDLGAPMAWTVNDPDLGEVDNGYGQTVNLLAGQSITAIYPEALSDPVVVQNSYTMDGDFSTSVENKYFTSYQLRFMELALGSLEYTVLDTEIEKQELGDSPQQMMDHTMNLTGFQTFQKAPFIIDPEKPIINVDQLSIEDVANVGSGLRQVVYKAVISNGGDVDLHDVLTTLDLGATFASASDFNVMCIYSKDMEVNANYDGVTDTDLLAPLNTLVVGQSGTIEILIEVKPEVSDIDANGCFGTVDYTASTKAYGVSPIGTAVESNVYHCTGVPTAADIIASVDLGASVIDELTDFTIYATEEVSFRKTSALCQGNVGSTDRVKFENASLFTQETATIIGDIHAGVELKLIGTYDVVCDYIQVGDTLFLNGSASLNPTGAMSYPSDCVGVQQVPDLTIPENNSNVQVTASSGSTMTLLPGSYKKVKHQANSTVKMNTGTYNIDTWVVAGDDARIEFYAVGGPVIINIGKWQPANSEGLEMVIADGVSAPGSVIYNYTGPQPVNFDASHVQGIVNAPIAAVTFDEGSHLEGRCYAEKVIFSLQSYYTDPSYLEDLNIDPSCQPQPRSLELELAQWGGYSTDLGVRVVPNPFQGSTSLWLDLNKGGSVTVELFDMLGKRVMEIPATVHPEGQQTLDLGMEGLLPGSYLVRVSMGEQVVTTRLVKTN